MAIDNADMLWVCPGWDDGGMGTYEDPFRSISAALRRVRPGQTVVLKSGEYCGDVTLQCSGSLEHPIHITSDERRGARIAGAAWFFYDVSDVVVTHLEFVHSPRSAVSVIGACRRNRFANLRFTGCGNEGETACAIFFGGSGGACNIVEECVFERASLPRAPGTAGKGACVGVMASPGDADGRMRDCIFRRNQFVNHTFGILVGGGDANATDCGHIIEGNLIDGCVLDGILVTCGDTTVRNNTVRNCRRGAIAVTAGRGSVVEDNRVLDCATGVVAAGAGHTVRNNCLIRCAQSAVHVNGNPDPAASRGAVSSNIVVEANTCVDCGAAAADVVVDGVATCVIRRNLFHGPGAAYRFALETQQSRHGRFVSDNILSGEDRTQEGAAAAWVVFAGQGVDNYDNDSGFGAQGWMVRSDVCELPPIDGEEARAYCLALEEEAGQVVDALIEEVNDEEIARRSMLMGEDETCA